MAVTIQDIANAVDVSTATVSRSLRHDKLIHPETRARINEVARHMGYQGRPRRQRTPVEAANKNHTLGLLIRHESLEAAHHDGNLMKMMAGVMAVADEHRMHLKIHNWPHDEHRHLDDESLVQPMIQGKALIVHGEHSERDMEFLAHRVPIVSIGRMYRNLPIDAAVGDNIEGVHELVTYLVGLGHNRLAWVSPPYHATHYQARRTGFIQGCFAHDLEAQSLLEPDIYEGGDPQVQKSLLAAVTLGVTGFVCASDTVALAVIALLEGAGVRVPDDVSVTGFDAWAHPTKTRLLTTIDPFFFEIGKAAVRLALQRSAYPVERPCIVNVRGKVVPGDSTAQALATSAMPTQHALL